MEKNDSVLCACCGREFSMRLLEMARWKGPLWCRECIERADNELVEASRRARIAQGPFVEQE